MSTSPLRNRAEHHRKTIHVMHAVLRLFVLRPEVEFIRLSSRNIDGLFTRAEARAYVERQRRAHREVIVQMVDGSRLERGLCAMED